MLKSTHDHPRNHQERHPGRDAREGYRTSHHAPLPLLRDDQRGRRQEAQAG